MLYTGKGDKGKTKLFGCCREFSKSAPRVEALGALDELNSLLGVLKTKAKKAERKILEAVQQNLFIIQAEIARPQRLSVSDGGRGGSDKKLAAQKIKELEQTISAIEKKLPKIKSFVLPGGTELSAQLDYARAVARRAERRVVACKPQISAPILAYLNRLSSLLYALARSCNYQAGIKDKKPTY